MSMPQLPQCMPSTAKVSVSDVPMARSPLARGAGRVGDGETSGVHAHAAAVADGSGLQDAEVDTGVAVDGKRVLAAADDERAGAAVVVDRAHDEGRGQAGGQG